MIRTFADKEAELIFEGRFSRKIDHRIQQRAREKLKLLDAATTLIDLRIPPSNLLEALKGKRQGQWSIRINDQWRVCFRFENGDAFEVEIEDYH